MLHQIDQFRAYLPWLLLSIATTACSSGDPIETAGQDVSSPAHNLSAALSFHASFDQGPNADFARGDRQIYTAPAYDQLDQTAPGIGNPDIGIESGAGRFGDALKFNRKNTHALFYRADKNVAFSTETWAGTISFWLNLDPNLDLEPGYCDPIQVTDSAYDDAAIWVDFSKDEPRRFRLGVFGDREAWNPQKLASEENPDFMDRLVAVTEPPFGRGSWTHIVITHTGLNSDVGGMARLYLNGEFQGAGEGIHEPFSWEVANSAIRLGVNYVGLFDELALFDKALSDEEIRILHRLEAGMASLHE